LDIQIIFTTTLKKRREEEKHRIYKENNKDVMNRLPTKCRGLIRSADMAWMGFEDN